MGQQHDHTDPTLGSQEFVPAGLISLGLMGLGLACIVPTRTCVRDPGQMENRGDAMTRVSVQKLGNLACHPTSLCDLGPVTHFHLSVDLCGPFHACHFCHFTGLDYPGKSLHLGPQFSIAKGGWIRSLKAFAVPKVCVSCMKGHFSASEKRSPHFLPS